MNERATILMYHSVADRSDYLWSVAPADFELQMEELAKSGRPVITLAELARRLSAGESLAGAVALTFDDGYRDNLIAALPILQKHHFPATIFITTDSIGASDKGGFAYLSREEMKEMQKSGLIAFAPHTKSHPRLTELSVEDARAEIEGSRAALAEITGERSPFFAYPYGGNDSRIRQLVRELGFTLALTTRSGSVGKGSDLLRLPRNEINSATDLHAFHRALTRAADLDGFESGIRSFYNRAGVALKRRARYWGDTHRHLALGRALLRLMPYPGRLTLLSDAELKIRQDERRAERGTARTSGREELVSIGVFACNRLDLLKETCASLGAYLKRYGGAFPHEVLLFHDGENKEIEAWAKANSLFDRIFFNPGNNGLSKNINRFWFEESKGKYLINIEDDWRCDFKDDFIKNGLAVLKADENVGCVRFERKYPGDYRKWDEAYKIHMRVMSARVFSTALGHRYRILEAQENGEGIYANSCTLYRFEALELAGKLRDDASRRRAQEPEYMRAFNRFYEGARGISQKDSPFLHIGYGKSVATWN